LLCERAFPLFFQRFRLRLSRLLSSSLFHEITVA
jgi:hypothetical protein